MQIIVHRCNSIKKLLSVPLDYGVEIDIRTFKNKLILCHDPFKAGTLLDEWLNKYKHKMIILNLKEDGLELACEKLLKKNKISNYLLLDQAFPTIIKSKNKKNTLIRVSEFEAIETALKFKNKIKWIWLDSFKNFQHKKRTLLLLKDNNFKICLVSPELHGRNDSKEIASIKNKFKLAGISLDAVCTKFPKKWISH